MSRTDRAKPSRAKAQRSPQRRPPARGRAPALGLIDHVAALLELVLRFDAPADTVVSAYFRQHPVLGQRDRGDIAEAVYTVLRRKLEFAHLAESGSGPLARRLALLGLAASMSPARLQPLLQRGRAGAPASDEAAWLERLRAIDRRSLSASLRDNLPDWLAAALDASVGAARRTALAAALLEPAPLDLRVNTVVATREAVLDTLADAGIDARPTPYASTGIRLAGKPALHQLPLFQQGAVEVQDEGSQLLAALVAPRRGELVIDFCAGAGGKTLALGALMRNSGRLYALDVSEKRLARFKPRFARSGLSNVHPMLIDSETDPKLKRLAGKADRVLVDAPCSGLGTLRRNPDLKWRQTPAKIAEMNVKQAAILAAAARLVRPGGRLVYATCSPLPAENRAIVDAFLAAHADFVRMPASEALREARIELSGGEDLELSPDTHGTDGFYAAILVRRETPEAGETDTTDMTEDADTGHAAG